MKKFIAVAFSYVIICGSGGCTMPTQDAVASGGISCIATLGNRFESEADLDDFFKQFHSKMDAIKVPSGLQTKVDELKTKVKGLKGKVGSLKTITEVKEATDCKDQYCKLFQDVRGMQKIFDSFRENIRTGTRVEVWDYIDDVRRLTSFLPRGVDGQYFYSKDCKDSIAFFNKTIESLKEKIKGLQDIVGSKEFAKEICVLSPRLTSDEIAVARCLCKQMVGWSDNKMDECISKSKKNMERFCGSTAGCSRLFLGHMPRSKSFEAVLSIVGYHIFVLGIRSFIGDLLSAYDRWGNNHANNDAANRLSLIYCGENRYVKQVPPPPVPVPVLTPIQAPVSSVPESSSGVPASSSDVPAISDNVFAEADPVSSHDTKIVEVNSVSTDVEPIPDITMIFPDGSKYEGGSVDGKKNGKGKITSSDDRVLYEGQFENDALVNGTVNWYDHNEKLYQTYVGSLKFWQLDGKGTLTQQNNGSKYEGDFVKGKRQGKGTLTYKDGSKYEGDFANDERHGKGILTYKDGSKYEGIWKNDGIRGIGTLTYPSRESYVGRCTVAKDKEKGKETLKANGKGKWRDAGGKTILDGLWEHGIYKGTCMPGMNRRSTSPSPSSAGLTPSVDPVPSAPRLSVSGKSGSPSPSSASPAPSAPQLSMSGKHASPSPSSASPAPSAPQLSMSGKSASHPSAAGRTVSKQPSFTLTRGSFSYTTTSDSTANAQQVSYGKSSSTSPAPQSLPRVQSGAITSDAPHSVSPSAIGGAPNLLSPSVFANSNKDEKN